ncbi:hypothetical protein C7271_02255 [filamentous cyanobacterium CCP5]|nr:hypothetical protein C7271_02255 [filamentous cyanobacterium CCP5]
MADALTAKTVVENIAQAFVAIEQKQAELERLPGNGYDTEPVCEIHESLISLCEAVKDLLNGEGNGVEALVQDVDRIADFCRQKRDIATDPTWAVDPAKARRDLYKALRDIEDAIDDFALSQSQRNGPSSITGERDQPLNAQINQLRSQLDQSKQLITSINSDKSSRSHLLNALHDLVASLYRIEDLIDEIGPSKANNRYQVSAHRLNSLVEQIKFIVRHCEPKAESMAELLLKQTAQIDRKLCRYEHRWGFGWMINRFHDIRRMRSKRGRILAGLGLSVSLAVGSFAFLSIFFAAIASLAVDQQNEAELEQKKNNLVEAVNSWSIHQADRRTLESDLDALRSEVDNLREIFWNNAEDQGLITDGSLDSEEALPIDTITSMINTLEDPGQDNLDIGDFELTPLRKEETNGLSEAGNEILNALRNLRDTRAEIDQKSTELDSIESQLSASQANLKTISQEIRNLNSSIANNSSTIAANNNVSSLNGTPVENGSESIPGEIVSLTNSIFQMITGFLKRVADLFRFLIQPFANLAQWFTNETLLDHIQRLVLAILAGILGSAISILIRLDKLDDENIKDPFAFGALKPVIGGVFGMLAFAVVSTKVIDILPRGFEIYPESTNDDTASFTVNSDPLGPLDSQEFYKIFIIAFLAGFSERLVGDTLRSIDRRPPSSL